VSGFSLKVGYNCCTTGPSTIAIPHPLCNNAAIHPITANVATSNEYGPCGKHRQQDDDEDLGVEEDLGEEGDGKSSSSIGDCASSGD